MSEQMLSKKSERQTSIELMRIFAMIMIVGCHFATHGGFSFENGSVTIPQIWWHVLYLGGNFGTDIFVMISGYFLISDTVMPPRSSKIILFWLQVFFYSIALFVISFPLGYGDFSAKAILHSVLPISFSQWWFASAYFVLFILHPYINIALNVMSKKQYQGFLIIIIVMWSIIPTITTQDFQKNGFIELFIMYAIAGYIKKYGILEQLSCVKWGALWLLSSILTVGSAMIILIVGKNNELISSHSTYFYSQTCLLTIVRAIAFFMMFNNMKISNSVLVNRISSTMFGVYLLHDSKLLRVYLWRDVFHNADYQNSIGIIPYSMFVILLVAISCVLIELLRQFLIEKKIRKWIFRHNIQ